MTEQPTHATEQVLGVDVGGTHLRVCVAWRDAHGHMHHGPIERIRWTRDGEAPSPVHLIASIESIAWRLCAPDAEVVAGLPSMLRRVGVGFAAQLSADGRTVLNAPNLGWREVGLAGLMEQAWKLAHGAVLVLNDLKAILAGEMAMGAARGVDSAIAFYVGTGVGGALAVRGQLWTGAGGNAGEIGHVKIHGYDGLCGCGERGCVEALAGGGALRRQLREWSDAGGVASHLVADAPGTLDVEAWDRASGAGDAWAVAFRDKVADALGHVLSGAITFCNPELVLLGGGVFEHAPHLATCTQNRANELTLAACRANVRYAAGSLGDSAGVLGAAGFALQRGFSLS
jgi:glucokinase